MRSLPRSVMALLALLSLLATLVPSLAWACPVTGRIGTPQEVCLSTAQSRRAPMAQMACCRKKQTGPLACASLDAKQNCAMAGRCCRVVLSPRPVSVAVTLADKTNTHAAPSILLDGVASVPTVARSSVAFVLPTHYRSDIRPLHSQNAFSLHSGRAPPVAA